MDMEKKVNEKQGNCDSSARLTERAYSSRNIIFFNILVLTNSWWWCWNVDTSWHFFISSVHFYSFICVIHINLYHLSSFSITIPCEAIKIAKKWAHFTLFSISKIFFASFICFFISKAVHRSFTHWFMVRRAAKWVGKLLKAIFDRESTTIYEDITQTLNFTSERLIWIDINKYRNFTSDPAQSQQSNSTIAKYHWLFCIQNLFNLFTLLFSFYVLFYPFWNEKWSVWWAIFFFIWIAVSREKREEPNRVQIDSMNSVAMDFHMK